MPIPTLVISHPPHGDVDLRRAAAILKLVPADVQLKIHYTAPEIWLAEEDLKKVESAAAILRAAGVRLAVVPGAALAAIPPPRPVAAFRFDPEGLYLEADTGTSVLGYDTPLIAVLFTPRPAETKWTLPPSSLDLYDLSGSAHPRWTIVQGTTGFAGMGARQSASFGTNVRNFAGEVERRFAAARMDWRLVNMQVRRRTGAPPPGATRYGYSFATGALNQLLESIAPGLSALDHEEFATRLALLTRAAE